MRQGVDIIEENDFFYCIRITDAKVNDLSSFTVDAGYGLLYYLQHTAMFDEASGDASTYVVLTKYTDEIVAYFTLKTGLVSLNEGGFFSFLFPPHKYTSGVELTNFAVNSTFKHKYGLLKIGSTIFKQFVLPIVKRASAYVSVKVLYIFALPEDKLIETYQRDYGFKRLSRESEQAMHRRLRPRYDNGCVFMYQNLK